MLCLLAICCSARIVGSPNSYALNAVQPKTDTIIPTPDSTLRKLLIAADQRNSLAQKIALLEDQIKTYEQLTNQYQTKDSITVKYWSGQLANVSEQKNLATQTIASLNKQIKRMKRRQRLTAFSGIAATALTIFITMKK